MDLEECIIAKSLIDEQEGSTCLCSRLCVQLLSEQLTRVRCQVCRLQLLLNAACSRCSVLWFARRHAQGETGSAQALLPNHDRVVHRTSVDHGARDVECLCTRHRVGRTEARRTAAFEYSRSGIPSLAFRRLFLSFAIIVDAF